MAIRVSRYTAVLDACVLYRAPLRDRLMEFAVSGLFRAKWTDRIHDEWTESVLAKRPDIAREKLVRTRRLMDIAVMDCLVTGYEALIEAVTLPDPKDRHVLAAAVKAGADAIVTFNLKDFPPDVMNRYGIEVQHPDEFIRHQIGLDQAKVIVAAQKCRSRLKNPPYSVVQYLETLEAQSLPLTVASLQPYAAVL